MDRAAIPHRVFDLPEPPRQLFLVGELPRAPAVAVVGTRRPTDDAIGFTAELVQELGRNGVAIWSGGAEGIDAAAHRAALRVGAPTVVVAPAGWGRPYPAEHATLYREIVEQGGAYLSLVPPERAAQPHLFFARNALLMALVQVVVIVQAGLRSGARNAAKFARRLRRPIFVAPSCPWVYQGLGCNAEIKLGARVLGSPRDVLRAICGYGVGDATTPMVAVAAVRSMDLEHTPPTRAGQCRGSMQEADSNRCRGVRPGRADAELDAELSLLIDAIRAGARNVDALCDRTGLGITVVQSDVLRLTLLGRVRTDRVGAIELVND